MRLPSLPGPFDLPRAWLLPVLAALLSACASVPAPEPTPTPAVVVDAPLQHAAATSVATPATAPAAAAVGTQAWRNPDRARQPADPARTDLWVRVRQGFAVPDVDDELVRKWEAYYAARPDYVARMMERGSRYLFHIVEEVDSRGLPMELALLPFIESAFNPQAMSTAAASGMWQFVAATGRDFDLKQNVFRDDRRDVIASTRAALDYLKQLNGMFDDWQLALAAYNWGQGSVQRAQRKNAARKLPTDYASLSMPAETRNYVPKLQAVKNIVSRPQDFGLSLPALENHPFFLGVAITGDIDVELAASLSGLSVAEFKQFNPQMNQPVILAAGTPQILLPYDSANRFLRGLDQHHGPLASWTAWVAPRTLSTAQAASLLGMDESALRELNHIPPRMKVKAGSVLLVPRNGERDEDVGEHLADHAAIVLAPDSPPVRRLVVLAGRQGETIPTLARRYGVPASELARWNGVRTDARFKAGTRIVVMLPKSSGATRPKSSGKPAAKPAAKSPAKAPAPRARAKS